MFQRRIRPILLAALLATGIVAAGVTTPAAATTAPERYLVDATSLVVLQDALAVVPTADAEVLSEVVSAVVDLTSDQAALLDAEPGVTVSKDVVNSITDIQDNAPWQLDRLDQYVATTHAASTNQQYWYPSTAGTGVRIYIVDTGVQQGITDLAGRVETGINTVTYHPDYPNEPQYANGATDCNGHGTAVAATAAGTVYGAAKKATIVPVRVMHCDGKGFGSDLVSGLNWILANHPAGTPGVINLSLGSLDKTNATGFSAQDGAVADAVAAGFFVTIAAGNNAKGTSVPDACQVSPARVPSAFTVGALDPAVGSAGIEGRAEFSNAGSCVDLFAPGLNVLTSATDSRAVLRSGTSFSAPVTAGTAAVYLDENDSCHSSNSEVTGTCRRRCS